MKMIPDESGEEEHWRPVPSFPQYDASSRGRLRRMRRSGEKILHPRAHVRGYRMVDISVNGKRHSVTVHSMVCEAFHGPRLERQVNHKNADKADNRPANLEWVTRVENAQHAVALGLYRRHARAA